MTEDHYIALLEARNRELAKTHEVLKRVRELHVPHDCDMATRHTDCFIVFGNECRNVDRCTECRHRFPCPTVQALDGAS